MSEQPPKRGSMFIEEATVSNMWEFVAIVELLEQKGLCTKQTLHTIINELRRKNPHVLIPETAFPEPYLLTDTENTIIDDILELLNKNGLTSHQLMNLLERLGRIIERNGATGGEGGDALSMSGAEHCQAFADVEFNRSQMLQDLFGDVPFPGHEDYLSGCRSSLTLTFILGKIRPGRSSFTVG